MSALRCAALAFLLALSAVVPRCDAIYAEQAGRYDWHQTQIGRVKEASFIECKTSGGPEATTRTTRAVAVITDRNVLAVLNLRSGEIIWRKLLETDASLDDLKHNEDKGTLFTLSDNRTRVSAWDASTGSLLWVEEFDRVSSLAVGRVYLAVATSDRPHIAFVDSGSGRIKQRHTLNEHNGVEAMGASGSQSLFTLAPDSSGVLEWSMANMKNKPRPVNLPSFAAQQGEKRVLISGSVLTSFAEGSTVVAEMSRRATEPEMPVVPGGGVTSAAYEAEGSHFVAIAKSGDGACELTVWDVGAGEARSTQRYTLDPDHHGSVASVHLSGYKSKQGDQGFRALVVSEDNSLALLQQGKVVWLREEALADVKAQLVVDFTEGGQLEGATAEQEPGRDLLSTLVDDMEMQLLSWKAQLKLAAPGETARLDELKKARARLQPTTFDSSGFRREVLLLTSVGKLFALHSGDGRILRAQMMGYGVERAEMHERRGSVAIFSWDAEGTFRSSSFDKATGQVTDLEQSSQAGLIVLSLPMTGRAGQADLLVNLATKEARKLGGGTVDLAAFKPAYLYKVDERECAVSGYALQQGHGGAVSVAELWKVQFTQGERILGSASPDHLQSVYSRTRILGDRSTLYRYLNPNTLFVATETEAEDDGAKLKVYLIDTVTGRVLYRLVHPQAQGPVRAVFCENWVVYQYWGVKGNRNEMSVLELYEDEPKHSGSILSHIARSLGSGANETDSEASSYSAPSVRVIGQSYILGVSVKAVAVTSTGLGITARQVLMATTADQVYALDKKLLDPRRPVKPTSEDKEEGLIPYSEYMPIMPSKYVTHVRQVLGLRQITSYPTRRESNTLVLATGLDLFFARMMPSKSFDMLDEDFSGALLLATLLALLVGAATLHVLVQRDNVKRNWM